MKNCWVWLVVVAAAIGCQKNAGDGAPAASSSAAPAAVASAAAKAITTCNTEFEYLVPPQKYADGDLIRAILVDGDQVYYRNMSEAFRVPLAGGAPQNLGKAPGLSLSGTTVLWAKGDKLLTQSAGEPIFMSAPKTGGAWSNMIDLTAAKHGGGHDPATRVLRAVGSRSRSKATRADFDGQTFYFAEVSGGGGPGGPARSVLKSVPFTGGEARTLFEAPGEIGDVTRAGDYLSFLLTEPPTKEQVKENEAKRKAKKYVFGVRGETHLMSLPIAGGSAKKLLRIGPFMSGLGLGGVTLGADGQNLYVSGYREQDLTKPGVFRIDVATGGIDEIDKRVLDGSAFVSGDTLVLIGGGMVDPTKNDYARMVLTAPRRGKALTLVACTSRNVTLHASFVSGKTALLALFDGATNLAGIARVTLP
jgi:hypothetical protein